MHRPIDAKVYTRPIDAKVYTSCRFDKKGHPPPECEFIVCTVHDKERKHLVMQSCKWPNEGNVLVKGQLPCDGITCRTYMVLKTAPQLTHVKQLDYETEVS